MGGHTEREMGLQEFIQIVYKLTKQKSVGVDEIIANNVDHFQRAMLGCHSLFRFHNPEREGKITQMDLNEGITIT